MPLVLTVPLVLPYLGPGDFFRLAVAVGSSRSTQAFGKPAAVLTADRWQNAMRTRIGSAEHDTLRVVCQEDDPYVFAQGSSGKVESWIGSALLR